MQCLLMPGGKSMNRLILEGGELPRGGRRSKIMKNFSKNAKDRAGKVSYCGTLRNGLMIVCVMQEKVQRISTMT
jgi:hypothetical protein